MGSNIAPKENILHALESLKSDEKVSVTNISSFYRTPPIDGKKQDDFLNGVFKLSTGITPGILKRKILNTIEEKLRRERGTDKFASRTIDLDILLFGNMIFSEEGMKIPDPDIYARNFIAAPLRELDPHLVLPDSGTRIDALAVSNETEKMHLEAEFTQMLRERLFDE